VSDVASVDYVINCFATQMFIDAFKNFFIFVMLLKCFDVCVTNVRYFRHPYLANKMALLLTGPSVTQDRVDFYYSLSVSLKDCSSRFSRSCKTFLMSSSSFLTRSISSRAAFKSSSDLTVIFAFGICS